MDQKLNDVNRSLSQEISDINQKLHDEIDNTKKEVKHLTYSNVWLELFGVFCVMLGLLYATIPDILVCYISL